MKKILTNYNLGLVLFLLFLGSWIGQGYFQWQEFVENAKTHQETISMAQFFPEFMSATFENWQSEFLQLFTMVALTSFLIFKGSPESRDGDDEMKQQLTRIEKLLSTKGKK